VLTKITACVECTALETQKYLKRSLTI